MKNIGIVLFILIIGSGLICSEVEFSSEDTLLELSIKTEIPVRKYIQHLEIAPNTDINVSLHELNITKADIEKARKAYDNNLLPFYSGVVLVGMAIVFVSLIFTGFVIHLLKYVSNRPKRKVKKKSMKTSAGTVTGPVEHLSSNAVIAAITAIYLHEMEVEEQNKMLLTWKRASRSMWKTGNAMPNNEYFQAKRGR